MASFRQPISTRHTLSLTHVPPTWYTHRERRPHWWSSKLTAPEFWSAARQCWNFQCDIETSSYINTSWRTAFVLTGHLPWGSLLPHPAPPVPPGPVWLHVCAPTWLVQGPSVPVEAAMAADNANWLPVITTNCPTARNWADTLGGVCLSMCVSSARVHSKLKFFLTLWEKNCLFAFF